MIKLTIKKILNKLGFSIHRYKKNSILVNLEEWTPLYKKNKNFQLYFKGLKKSKEEWADSFSKQMRLYSLIQLVEKILSKSSSNDFVECGCWRGHSSFVISSLIKQKKKSINFHIFDSFEGLSESTKKDDEFFKKDEVHKKFMTNIFKSSEEFLKNDVLKEFGFVKTYKGWIPSRFSEVRNLKFSFVHIDVDLYEPTLDCLEFFFPRLVNGGVIVCDDYNSSQFPGAKNAWDYYFKNKKINLFYEQSFGGCFLIK
jgi:O-methyltransferase